MSRLVRSMLVAVLVACSGCSNMTWWPGGQNKTSDQARQGKANVLAAMQAACAFDTFNELICTAGVAAMLQEAGPYTVLAPTDDAFARLPAGKLEELLRPQNHAALRTLVLYHIVPGKLTLADLQRRGTLPTLAGQSIQVRPAGQTLLLNEQATVLTGDIPAANGIIHALEGVLIPPAK
jgi:transforming growth factor-beta-induced protein